ncbi:hypothetical protein [Roseomonas sp. BN140053]|uniref:hypothetical protein n=1 Tax=Roseomonas sp. BN140053 TaxID=3391898 RepID=UPI0039EB88A0
MPSRAARSVNESFPPDVLAAAQRLNRVQERMAALTAPATLAEAIERDFLLFDLHDARRALRAAMHAPEISAELPPR